MGDDTARPSLLLVKQDLAHREHIHQHNHFHKRQATAVVTEVVATVSVVQQVDVDSNGSTFATETLLVTTEGSSPATTDESPAAAATTTTAIANPPIVTPASAATSTSGGSSQPDTAPALQSLLSSQSTTSASTTFSIPTRFPSLILSSNSTSLISSSSSLPFFNSSIISSRTSLTYLTSSSSSSDDFTDSSTSTLYSPSFSATGATSTGAGGYAAGGTQAASGSTPSSTAESGNGTSNASTPSTPVVVGGVVGSLAGAAIVIFLLMFLIRWKKRHQSMFSLDSVDRGAAATAAPDGPPPQPSGGMTERRSLAYGVPAALATLAGYKRSSQKTETDRTISSTADSERGFYRVSGRKLPSVLHTGGDGYGGGIDRNTLSGSSFYRDSQGFYGGPGSPSSPSHPPAGTSIQRDSGVPVMRPSPARTPVTEQSPFSVFSAPPNPPPRRPDVLGRSHPSQDGSHASRFTEEV